MGQLPAHRDRAPPRPLHLPGLVRVRERLDPLDARPTDLSQFKVWRELGGGRAAKASTVARALASVSSWYNHLVANTDGRVARNPATGVKRPKVHAHTSTPPGSPFTKSTLRVPKILSGQFKRCVCTRGAARRGDGRSSGRGTQA